MKLFHVKLLWIPGDQQHFGLLDCILQHWVDLQICNRFCWCINISSVFILSWPIFRPRDQNTTGAILIFPPWNISLLTASQTAYKSIKRITQCFAKSCLWRLKLFCGIRFSFLKPNVTRVWFTWRKPKNTEFLNAAHADNLNEKQTVNWLLSTPHKQKKTCI